MLRYQVSGRFYKHRSRKDASKAPLYRNMNLCVNGIKISALFSYFKGAKTKSQTYFLIFTKCFSKQIHLYSMKIQLSFIRAYVRGLNQIMPLSELPGCRSIKNVKKSIRICKKLCEKFKVQTNTKTVTGNILG